MGIIGDIINLPIRLIKIPFKILALPVRIPMHIIFGSKKDQLAKERAKEKAEFEKQKSELQNKATPFFMSGNPDDMAILCKNLPPDIKDEKIKAICALAKKSGGSKTRRLKKRFRKARRLTQKYRNRIGKNG
jgi:hypothetical protein